VLVTDNYRNYIVKSSLASGKIFFNASVSQNICFKILKAKDRISWLKTLFLLGPTFINF
jgi:hypothetical protein